jgi:hypothetical protein
MELKYVGLQLALTGLKFYSYILKDSILRREDERIKFIPFMVGKPTLDEVNRIHDKISTVTFRKRSVGDMSVAVDNDTGDITSDSTAVEALKVTDTSR